MHMLKYLTYSFYFAIQKADLSNTVTAISAELDRLRAALATANDELQVCQAHLGQTNTQTAREHRVFLVLERIYT